jgi:hypothetical protein
LVGARQSLGLDSRIGHRFNRLSLPQAGKMCRSSVNMDPLSDQDSTQNSTGLSIRSRFPFGYHQNQIIRPLCVRSVSISLDLHIIDPSSLRSTPNSFLSRVSHNYTTTKEQASCPCSSWRTKTRTEESDISRVGNGSSKCAIGQIR